MIHRCAVAVTLAVSVVAATSAQSMKFTPPRLSKAELPPLPAPTIAGGGEVLIEAIVDQTGRTGRPVVLRGTPPYTQMVLDAMALWRFEPAHTVAPDGTKTAVDMPIAIAAIYRPPVLMNAPTIGEPAKDWSKPSTDLAYPLSLEMPNYPPHARDGGVVLFEVVLDETGVVRDTRGVASIGAFESTSREALAKWRFKGGAYRARPVSTTAYVLFGFRAPVVSSPGQQPNMPPTFPPFPPKFNPPPPPNFTAPPSSKP